MAGGAAFASVEKGYTASDGMWAVAPRSSIDLDELVEHWTVLDDERALVDAKNGGIRLGFALLLKHYTRYGRFPSGRMELPDAAIEFVARQLQVQTAEIGAYEWSGRSVERHRAQIREHLGYRECGVVRSALHAGETALSLRVTSRLSERPTIGRRWARSRRRRAA